MSTIPEKPDRSSQIFADESQVYLPIHDGNEGLAVNQDGRMNLPSLRRSNARSQVVVNKTGGSLSANSIVALDAYSDLDGAIAVVLADNASGIRANGFLPAALVNDEVGVMLARGVMAGIDTSGGSVGDLVYLGAGVATVGAPSAGIHQRLGKVVKAAVDGQVWFDVAPPVEDETLVKPWRANTPYTQHQLVYYDGKLWLALTDFASGGTFTRSNWMPADRAYQIANVIDYGANPNSDASTDNYDAIVAAIASGARGIFFPPGRYRIETAIKITDPDTVVFGVGPTSSLEQATDLQNVIEFEGPSASSRLRGCRLYDMRIRGVRAWDPTILKNVGSSTQNLGVYAKYTNSFVMTNCEVDSCVGYGFSGYGSAKIQVIQNYFHDQYFDPALPDPNAGNGDITAGSEPMLDCVITDNIFASNAKTHIFNASVGRSMVISNNTFAPLDDNGDLVPENQVNLSHNINYAYGDQDSIVGEQSRFIISDNICSFTRVGGIYGSALASTTDPDVGPETIIANNILYRIGINTTTTDETINGAIIVYPCRDVMISDNLVLDYQGIGKAIRLHGSTTAAKGKYTAKITGNVVRGSVRPGIAVYGRHNELEVAGNIVRDADEDGILLELWPDVAGEHSRVVCRGNSIRDAGTNGIRVRCIEEGIQLRVEDNDISDCAERGIQLSEYLRHVVVDNNIVRDNLLVGIELISTQFSTGAAHCAITRNMVTQQVNADSLYVQYEANPDLSLNVSENVLDNQNVSLVADGIQLNVDDWQGKVNDNDIRGNAIGIRFATINGRQKGAIVRGNRIEGCGEGMSLVASNDGLLMVESNRFISCVSTFGAVPGLIEGVAMADGRFTCGLSLDAAAATFAPPNFGTWLQGDYVFNSDFANTNTRAIICVEGGDAATSVWLSLDGDANWTTHTDISGPYIIDFAKTPFHAIRVIGDTQIAFENIPKDRTPFGVEVEMDGVGGHQVDVADWDGLTEFQGVMKPVRTSPDAVTYYEWYASGFTLVIRVGDVTGGFESVWEYGGASGTPASGIWRREGVAELRINKTSGIGAYADNLLTQLPIGSQVMITETRDGTRGETWDTTGNPVDNGDWVSIAGTRTVHSNTVRAGNDCNLKFYFT